MKVTRMFRLERPARKSGGDRYEEVVPQGEKPIMGNTYVDQSVSRGQGTTPAPVLTITIESA